MLLASLEAEGAKYFAEDAPTCSQRASGGQAARAGGAKPGGENAAAPVDTQKELANRLHPPPSMEGKCKGRYFFCSYERQLAKTILTNLS